MVLAATLLSWAFASTWIPKLVLPGKKVEVMVLARTRVRSPSLSIAGRPKESSSWLRSTRVSRAASPTKTLPPKLPCIRLRRTTVPRMSPSPVVYRDPTAMLAPQSSSLSPLLAVLSSITVP
jgi:hypothetical protein